MSLLPQGTSGGRPPTNPPSTYRRLSYASVVSGTPALSNYSSYRPGSSLNSANRTSLPPAHIYFESPNSSSRQMAASHSREPHRVLGPWKRGPMEQYLGTQGSALDAANLNGDRQLQEFFVPSYLYGSKYIDRLEQKYKARMAAQREGRPSRSGAIGSLSTSTSSASLHKMVPSHRGMTHEIVERPHVAVEEQPSPLPSRWNHADKGGGLELQGNTGLEIKFVGTTKLQDEAAAIRSDHPMPRECGLYYFEVTVLGKGKEGLMIGFSGAKVSLSKPPGWELDSWAYHGDDGFSFCHTPSGKSYGQKFGSSDVIGCGVNFRTNSAFFTKNGINLGTAFREIKSQALYPSVGMKKHGEHVTVNFGQSPFVYDIDRMVATEKGALLEEISLESPKNLYSQVDETSFLQNLVLQYLAHEGYIDTAKTFTHEVQTASKLLHGNMDAASGVPEYKEDQDAVNRQRIRAAILNGDIDQAISYTNTYYPSVLQENENIYFKLRCRKFVEMIAKTTDSPPGSKQLRGLQKNDSASSKHRERDELSGVDNEFVDHMDLEEPNLLVKQVDLVNDALQYGQELQSEFKDDSRREVKQALKDTFALIAYPDARESSLAPLLEAEGRISVAEELNGAILVSLGRSSSAALERLCQHAEVLIDELSINGGLGSLINVRHDFLSQASQKGS